ncbi:MAG: ATP-binding protein [Pseudomonadota bacterium]
MIRRLCNLTKSNSFFLFGPRGTGKTTMILEQFASEKAVYVDLLDIDLMDQLLLDPSRFKQLIDSPENYHKSVIVDEVQKFPRILDVVHFQIQSRKRQFILTGSSSRRLKQQSSNLLAGRAWVYNLYPLSTLELGESFNLKKALEVGGLPEAYIQEDQNSSHEYLKAYTSTYLQKEIQQEQWVRKLDPFRRFLAIAAQMNGKVVNRSKIAKEAGVDDTTVANYFEILEDTLLGFYLPAYHKSARKSQTLSPKFYFIDPGIKRALDRTLTVNLLPQTFAWGDAFEHWVILEIVKNVSYSRLDWSFSFIRTKDGVEIDLVIERPGIPALFIEIKSKNLVNESDAKSLETLGRDTDPDAERWLLSLDPLDRFFGKTRALHWQKAITELFGTLLKGSL